MFRPIKGFLSFVKLSNSKQKYYERLLANLFASLKEALANDATSRHRRFEKVIEPSHRVIDGGESSLNKSLLQGPIQLARPHAPSTPVTWSGGEEKSSYHEWNDPAIRKRWREPRCKPYLDTRRPVHAYSRWPYVEAGVTAHALYGTLSVRRRLRF